MRQQINLYRPELSSKLPFPNFEHCLWTLLAVVVVVSLFTAVRFFHYMQQSDQIEALAFSKVNTEAELVSLQELLKGNAVEPVEAQIATLNEKLSELRNIHSLMGGENMESSTSGNRRGFSAQMEGLSRQYIDGIALSTIGFGKGGGEVMLKGEAASPEMIPRYLSGLDADPAFAQTRFGQIRLERQTDTGRLLFAVEDRSEEGEP